MADVIRSIRSSGGDYTNLHDLLTTEQTDLVAAGDNLVIEVYDDFSGVLDASVRMNNYPSFNTDASNRIIIRAPVSERHNGQLLSGATISTNNAYEPPFRADSQVVEIEWMIIHQRNSNAVTGAVGGAILRNCLVINESSGQIATFEYAYNTKFVRADNGTDGEAVKASNFTPIRLDYCTVINGYLNAPTAGGDIELNSTAIYNPNGAAIRNIDGRPEIIADSAFSGATAYGTNATTGVVPADFTDFANGDYTAATGGNIDGIGVDFVNPPVLSGGAPTLLGATASATGPQTYSASVTTDNATGTLYHIVNTSATATLSAIKAGASQPVTEVGVQIVTGGGLTEETIGLRVHFVHTDDGGQDSNVISTPAFNTPAIIPSAATVVIEPLVTGQSCLINTGIQDFNPTSVTFSAPVGGSLTLPITTAFSNGVGRVAVPALPSSEQLWPKFGLGKLVLSDGTDTVHFHGAYSSGRITVTGTDGSIISAGDAFIENGQSNGELAYYAFSDVVISGGSAVVEVVAGFAAASMDIAAGTTVNPRNPISGVDSTATVATGGITGGSTATFADVEPVLLPPAGHQVITVRNAVANEGSIFSEFPVPPDDLCQVIASDTLTLDPSGVFSTDYVGTQTIRLWDVVDGRIKPFTLETVSQDAAATGSVVITGTAQEGQVLTADVSSISDPDGIASITYSWIINTDEAVGTASTYTPTRNDVGDSLRVEVTVMDNDSNTYDFVSSIVTIASEPALEITANSSNPLPATVNVSDGSSYDLKQHFNIPNGLTPNFARTNASGPFGTGVSLSSDGVISNAGSASSNLPIQIEITAS